MVLPTETGDVAAVRTRSGERPRKLGGSGRRSAVFLADPLRRVSKPAGDRDSHEPVRHSGAGSLLAAGLAVVCVLSGFLTHAWRDRSEPRSHEASPSSRQLQIGSALPDARLSPAYSPETSLPEPEGSTQAAPAVAPTADSSKVEQRQLDELSERNASLKARLASLEAEALRLNKELLALELDVFARSREAVGPASHIHITNLSAGDPDVTQDTIRLIRAATHSASLTIE